MRANKCPQEKLILLGGESLTSGKFLRRKLNSLRLPFQLDGLKIVCCFIFHVITSKEPTLILSHRINFEESSSQGCIILAHCCWRFFRRYSAVVLFKSPPPLRNLIIMLLNFSDNILFVDINLIGLSTFIGTTTLE